jgi:LacI family transcriptional regulator
LKKNGKTQVKEIATQLGLSSSTISMVMNGRADEMGISKATQDRVKEAARVMNYQPSRQSQRIRATMDEVATKVIAVFWCTDFSDNTMGHFFKGLHRTMLEKDYKVNFYVHLYEYDQLKDSLPLMTKERYSGIIISGSSDKDIESLNEQSFDLPIVLMNRNEEKYHCVYVNDYEVGHSSGRLLHTRNHQQVGLVTLERKSHSAGLRQLGFLDACQKYGIRIEKEWVQEALGRDYLAGYDATKELLAHVEQPSALFVMAPGLVLGALQACKEAQLHVPRDIEVLTFGEDEILPFYSPTISSVHIPIETTAENALNLLMLVIDNQIQMPMSRMLLAGFNFRDSCGGF